MNHDEPSADPSRRDFLKKSFLSLGLLLGGRHIGACGGEVRPAAKTCNNATEDRPFGEATEHCDEHTDVDKPECCESGHF